MSDDKDYSLCEGTSSKEHEPDNTSVSIQSDGGTFYVDINCKHCGVSGCIAVLKADDVIWG